MPPHERCAQTPGAIFCGICGAAKMILDRHFENQRSTNRLASRAVLVCPFCDETDLYGDLRGPLATHRARLAAQTKGRS